MTELAHRRHLTPVGELTVVADTDTIVAILWPNQQPSCPRRGASIQQQLLDQACAELDDYFAGRRHQFDIAVTVAGSPFQRQAWDALLRIPYATTISYRDQATMAGSPQHTRAVGAANRANQLPIIIPCHRVVRSNGHLGGYTGGLATKAWLLEHERRHATTTS